MSEFCLECWNAINDTRDTEKRYLLSRDKELCEGCGLYKCVIIKERQSWRFWRKLVKLIGNLKK